MTKNNIARICSLTDCNKPYEAKGFCNQHYIRFRKYGDPYINHTLLPTVCTIEGCENRHVGRGLCGKHLQRQKLYGDPLLLHPKMGKGETYLERFWNRVDKTQGLGRDGDCWEWRGQKNGEYGAVRYEGVLWATHRLAYFLTTNIMPTQMILHSCDNPLCVNPSHLREGSVRDNSLDMVIRERQARGEKNAASKLNDIAVQVIRQVHKEGAPVSLIAKHYQVAIQTIYKLLKGVTWSHVP